MFIWICIFFNFYVTNFFEDKGNPYKVKKNSVIEKVWSAGLVFKNQLFSLQRVTGEVDRKYGKYVLTALDKINKKAENFILSVIPTSEGVHINRRGLGDCERTKQMKTAGLGKNQVQS